MDPSKPPSDIGAPSKASSDIGLSTIVVPDKADQPERTKKEKSSIRMTTDVNAVEDPPKVENARVEVKRGKLARSRENAVYDRLPPYNFASRKSLEKVREAPEGSYRGVELEKGKTRRAKYEFSKPIGEDSLIGSTEPKLKKSQSLTGCEDNVLFRRRNGREIVRDECRSKKSSANRLIKMEAVVNLDDIETDIEGMPECGILETRYSPTRSHVDNYVCGEKCRGKVLKHSTSFQSCPRLKDTRIVNAYERISSQSFCARKEFDRDKDPSRKFSSSSVAEPTPRLGDVKTTKFYDQGSIVSSHDDERGYRTGGTRNNLSPLSNLQIFAISTKPLDIQVAPIESIPNDIDELPSLPIVRHSDGKLEPEKKLSILEPPPPGLVSRQESNESWNQFLIQLNSILESRAGEFV